jgi:hypothetical protein
MTAWYVGATALLFTVMAVGAAVPPHRPMDAPAAAVLGALSALGWICFARLF